MTRIVVWALLWVVMVPAAYAQKAAPGNSLLWKIEGSGGKSSFLFGTYHLVGSDYLDTHDEVAQAYKNSSRVVVEMEADSAALMQLTMLATMPGRSFKGLLDSSDYQLVKKEIEPVIGYDLAMFDNFKPNLIATMYSVALAQRSTPEDFKYGGEPIDMFFASNGHKKGKEIIALETAREQADILFNSEAVEQQAHNLVVMLKEADETREITEKVLKAYQKEDLNSIWTETLKMGDAYGDMDILLHDRNKAWVKTLKEILPEGGVFIAVGALHLPGKKGLIRLLQKEGYTITPVH